MNRADILSELCLAPLLMEEPFGHSFIASMAALPEKLDWGGDDNGIDVSRTYPVVNGVAIIPIMGPLMHRHVRSWYYSSYANYMSIGDMMEDAVNDRSIKAVLCEYDTPGGVGAACLDLAERMREMRGVKPIWASVNQNCCSAGMALASGADRIEIAKSAKAGSIGVMAVHWDYSKALEKWGEKVTYLYAGKHKVDGAPCMPLTEQARDAFMASIEAEYERFCEVVAAGRGADIAKIKATEAAVFRGQAAVDAGLADAVATFEETLMSITKKTAPEGARLTSGANSGAPGSEGEDEMTEKTPEQIAAEAAAAQAKPPADPNAALAADAADIAEACQAAGHPELTASLIKAKPTMTAVKARLEEAKGIVEAAKGVGLATMGPTLVSSGVNLDTARKMLFDAKAAMDGTTPTDTAQRTVGAPATPKLDHRGVYDRMNAGKTAAK